MFRAISTDKTMKKKTRERGKNLVSYYLVMGK